MGTCGVVGTLGWRFPYDSGYRLGNAHGCIAFGDIFFSPVSNADRSSVDLLTCNEAIFLMAFPNSGISNHSFVIIVVLSSATYVSSVKCTTLITSLDAESK